MEAPPVERRLAAILAADVEGYSRLMHGDEEATMATLSARRAVVDELIVRHRGRIANTAGDSVLAEFVSVLSEPRLRRGHPRVCARTCCYTPCQHLR
jgi:adenylate cyclase